MDIGSIVSRSQAPMEEHSNMKRGTISRPTRITQGRASANQIHTNIGDTMPTASEDEGSMSCEFQLVLSPISLLTPFSLQSSISFDT